MINRIRDIRLQKGMTLADVAAACQPPTTAQTIGRLETGMRNLSLGWMNRIAAALKVEPETLLRSESTNEPPRIVAVLADQGAEAPRRELEAVPPYTLSAETPWLVMVVEASSGEYRAGDQVWLQQRQPEDAAKVMNRDVLVPRSGGRFAFGRLIGCEGNSVTLLPPASGQKQISVEQPAWVAVAEMLVRKL